MSTKVTTYPSDEQHKRWQAMADEMGMSMSEFIESMVEAGMKKFEVDVTPTTSVGELRRQRDECRQQLRDAQQRIEQLENQLNTTEQATIREFVEENPGTTFTEITQHLSNNVSPRVSKNLDLMVGRELREDGSKYYPIQTDDE